MGKVRVLRLLEYEYDSVETMEADMRHWQAPQNGVKSFGESKTIRSAVLPVMTVDLEVETGCVCYGIPGSDPTCGVHN